ncbi:MAG: Hsp20/alpha crystallin family protein [Nitrospinae bacterium]|nr:Hsp20/alpha crystallin family protein [Nitrospinota bacterium]
MNKLFEETLSRFQGISEGFSSGEWSPAVDIYETSDDIVLKAELPNISKDDIKIEIRGNILILKGKRRFKKGVKEENYHRIERSYGRFQRTFNLSNIVHQDKVKIRLKDGILEIILPKEEPLAP